MGLFRVTNWYGASHKNSWYFKIVLNFSIHLFFLYVSFARFATLQASHSRERESTNIWYILILYSGNFCWMNLCETASCFLAFNVFSLLLLFLNWILSWWFALLGLGRSWCPIGIVNRRIRVEYLHNLMKQCLQHKLVSIQETWFGSTAEGV